MNDFVKQIPRVQPSGGEPGLSRYTAVSEHEAKERFVEFTDIWGERYPAVIRLWENAWAEFVPFLDYSPEIRKIIYSTNAVESLHARMRRATRARGHFPTEQAASEGFSGDSPGKPRDC